MTHEEFRKLLEDKIRWCNDCLISDDPSDIMYKLTANLLCNFLVEFDKLPDVSAEFNDLISDILQVFDNCKNVVDIAQAKGWLAHRVNSYGLIIEGRRPNVAAEIENLEINLKAARERIRELVEAKEDGEEFGVDETSVIIDMSMLEQLTKDSKMLKNITKVIDRVIKEYANGYYGMYRKKISSDIKNCIKEIDEDSANWGSANAFRLISAQLPIIIETKIKELSK